MEEVLTSITKVEKELSLVEELVHNIFIFDLPEGNLIVNYTFEQSRGFDPGLIGGLSATIEEIAGPAPDRKLRSINLDEINILFVQEKGFLIVFVVDPNYPELQFQDSVQAFAKSLGACLKSQDYGSTSDGAAISAKTILSLISEELKIEFEIGSDVSIYPFKLRELAEESAQKIIGFRREKEVELYESPSGFSFEEKVQPINTNLEALENLMGQFINTFADVSQMTLIRTTTSGMFENFQKGRLPDETEERVYGTVMNSIDYVSHLLDMELDDRIIDLEDRFIYFHKVSDYSFLYVVIEDRDAIELIIPIVERVASSIHNLFPDDVDIKT